MPQLVTNGAQVACSFGTTPGSLTVVPMGPPLTAGGQEVGRVSSMIPMANIPMFGMCTTPSNPQVAAATSAALGVLTPQPCIPVTSAPWTPGAATVTAGGVPVLTAPCTCMCTWGGVITISSPGQTTVSSNS